MLNALFPGTKSEKKSSGLVLSGRDATAALGSGCRLALVGYGEVKG